MTKQEQYEIIELVVTIFQNVGIKRFIDKIDIMKNYQIYFEICKVIFPQTMIELLRFSQGSQTNAQRIQAVIKIVGDLLDNDLYHISGEAIAEGKLSHIRNFLHILELLSQNVHKVNRNESQVQSAPQNTRSISDYNQEGHYTVIGIDKQFQWSEDQQDFHHYDHDKNQTIQQKLNKKEYDQKNQRQNRIQKEQTDNQDSQSEKPMNPVMDKKEKTSKKKFVKSKAKPLNQKAKTNVQIVKPKVFKRSSQSNFNKQDINIPKLQQFMKKKQTKEQTRKKVKSTFNRKINNVIQDFEAKKLTDLKLQHNIWAKQHEIKTSQKQNRIQDQTKERMKFTNQFIIERKKKIDTLRNASQAVNIMANLFKQQRNIWRGMTRAKQQTELEIIESIIQNDQRDQQLLRQALMASNPQNSRKRKR